MDMHLRVWALNYRHPSKAEEALEKELHRALSTTVLRQYPVGRFIPDFLLPYPSIIIEVDDKSHRTAKRIKEDWAKRESYEQLGYLVLSITDDRCLDSKDVKEFVEGVRALIESLEKANPSLSDAPYAEYRSDYYRRIASERKEKKKRKEERERVRAAKATAKSELPKARNARRVRKAKGANATRAPAA